MIFYNFIRIYTIAAACRALNPALTHFFNFSLVKSFFNNFISSSLFLSSFETNKESFEQLFRRFSWFAINSSFLYPCSVRDELLASRSAICYRDGLTKQWTQGVCASALVGTHQLPKEPIDWLRRGFPGSISHHTDCDQHPESALIAGAWRGWAINSTWDALHYGKVLL